MLQRPFALPAGANGQGGAAGCLIEHLQKAGLVLERDGAGRWGAVDDEVEARALSGLVAHRDPWPLDAGCQNDRVGGAHGALDRQRVRGLGQPDADRCLLGAAGGERRQIGEPSDGGGRGQPDEA